MANRKKTMYAWGFITCFLFVVMFIITQCTQLSKKDMIDKMVEDCSKNIPFSDPWQKSLAALGVDKQPIEDTAKRYCECTVAKPFAQMDDQAIKTFIQSTPEARIKQLGGKDAMLDLEKSCLQQLSR